MRKDLVPKYTLHSRRQVQVVMLVNHKLDFTDISTVVRCTILSMAGKSVYLVQQISKRRVEAIAHLPHVNRALHHNGGKVGASPICRHHHPVTTSLQRQQLHHGINT